MKIIVTGAGGLLGWHAAARLHARLCQARYRGEAPPFELVMLDRAAFASDAMLHEALDGADAVLHFAGVNRGSEQEVAAGNPDIADRLVTACRGAGARPHIVYANSVHATVDNVYGRSKAGAGDILAGLGGAFTDIRYPHIFGERARPYYNNVTATFIDQVIKGETPTVDPNGQVQLLHAGTAAQMAIDAAFEARTGLIEPEGRPTRVVDLLDMIRHFHETYESGVFPLLASDFEVELFNTYRAALYPDAFPKVLKLHADQRGSLFEAAKGGAAGQTFMSWTHPGVTRGDHFHLRKVERFLVVQGEAIIRIRRVLGDEVREFPVSGGTPAAVDMPTLHTHSIENVGNGPLLTLFWTNEVFDPQDPDTYADPVMKV